MRITLVFTEDKDVGLTEIDFVPELPNFDSEPLYLVGCAVALLKHLTSIVEDPRGLIGEITKQVLEPVSANVH